MRLIRARCVGWGVAMLVLSWMAFVLSLAALVLAWLPRRVCLWRDDAEINYLLTKVELRFEQHRALKRSAKV
jgi:hypothetical protein